MGIDRHRAPTTVYGQQELGRDPKHFSEALDYVLGRFPQPALIP